MRDNLLYRVLLTEGNDCAAAVYGGADATQRIEELLAGLAPSPQYVGDVALRDAEAGRHRGLRRLPAEPP